MDGLTIVTGIFGLVFLLFYLAFNLNQKEHPILKIILVFGGLVLMLHIPAQIQRDDQECFVNSTGSYFCYLSNGTQVTNFDEQNDVGNDLFVSYTYLLRIVFGYIGIYLFYWLFIIQGVYDKIIRWLKKVKIK